MKVTIDDIARIAHVSKATISRVLNDEKGVGEETRNRIKSIIDEIGYKPNLLARGVATAKTKTIGVIIPDITNPFFPDLIKSIEGYYSNQGYTVLLCNTNSIPEQEMQAISTCIAKRVDGILLASSVEEPSEMHCLLKKYNMPCVLMDRGGQGFEADARVFVDNEYSVFMATSHLICNGNRRIAFLSGPANISTSKERLVGYLSALKQYGISPIQELICYGDYTLESGFQATKRLLDSQQFTALVSANDSMAVGAIKSIRQMGFRIPEDVEVIGYDNIQLGTLIEPRLSTVEQPISLMGKTASELLYSIINGGEIKERSVRLKAHLILRESTKNHQSIDMEVLP